MFAYDALNAQDRVMSPADDSMEEALRMVPDDPTLLEHYGDINFRLGQKSEAKSAYEKALLAGGPAITLRDKIRLRQNK